MVGSYFLLSATNVTLKHITGGVALLTQIYAALDISAED